MATEGIDKPSSLPPYPQMIVEAIEALNNKNGSNKTTISKYIESKYGELPANHGNLLSHYLHWMKENGELIFWKNNYMKPSSDTPPRRGRGRPPKPKDPLPLEGMQPPLSPPRPTRPRGRPPKDPNRVGVGTLSPKVGSGIGRPRGRPRKMAQPAGGIGRAGGIAAAVTGTGRPRGRPRKVKAAMAAEVRVEN